MDSKMSALINQIKLLFEIYQNDDWNIGNVDVRIHCKNIYDNEVQCFDLHFYEDWDNDAMFHLLLDKTLFELRKCV